MVKFMQTEQRQKIVLLEKNFKILLLLLSTTSSLANDSSNMCFFRKKILA
jgi:hypothetical protein